MAATPERYPSPEFLLDEADKEFVSSYLDSKDALTSDLRDRACTLELHQDKLFAFEMLAAARAQGLPRDDHGRGFSDMQTLPLLAVQRRAVKAIGQFSGMVSASGLGQACANYEDVLPFWIEAVRILAPPAFADELRRYIEQMHRLITAYRENVEPSAETLALWKGDGQTLERQVWETDWTTIRFRYMLDNQQWFFLQPHQGSNRLPVPDYYAMEVAWREAEQIRIKQEQLEFEAAADAKFTNLSCPACGMAMPGYRRTCKHCGVERGRA